MLQQPRVVSSDPSSMHSRQQSASSDSASSQSFESSQIAAVCRHTIGQTKTNIELGGTSNGGYEHSKNHI